MNVATHKGGAPLDHPRRCVARSARTGEPSRRYAARGGDVCHLHGGDAPDAVALAAIRDAVDRAGLIAPCSLDVAVGPAPWMKVFDHIASGSRSKSRAAGGAADEATVPEWMIPFSGQLPWPAGGSG